MAHPPISGHNALEEFCKALDIPTKALRKMVITMQCNDIVLIEITRLLTDDFNLKEIAEKYTIIKYPKEKKEFTIDDCYFYSESGICRCRKADNFKSQCFWVCGYAMTKPKLLQE